MTQDPIETIRENYNRVADDYARRIYGELAGKPFDRQILQRFANAVRLGGRVCDMGCGPGQVARCLRDAGAEVFGVDLSPQMVEQARTLNPDITFHEDNMLALDLNDSALAGITAFYAIVNLPPESLPRVFREMQRVLEPGGTLLLAFHSGDEVIRPVELWGQLISMEFHHQQPDSIVPMLAAAGFEIDEVIEREPYAPEVEYQSRRAYVLARKPNAQKV